MAYSPSNPPSRTFSGPLCTRPTPVNTGTFAEGGGRWFYESPDVAAVVAGAGYFTNGNDLGMALGDLVEVHDTTTPLVTMHRVIAVTIPVKPLSGGPVTVGTGTVIGL